MEGQNYAHEHRLREVMFDLVHTHDHGGGDIAGGGSVVVVLAATMVWLPLWNIIPAQKLSGQHSALLKDPDKTTAPQKP